MKRILLPTLLTLILLGGLGGCGVDYQFKQAKKFEKKAFIFRRLINT